MWQTDGQTDGRTDGRNCDSICALTAYMLSRAKITRATAVKQTNRILTVLWMSRMTEMNLGWHQVGCSRCVDQRRRTTCHQMKSACAVRGASHCQLISFLDVGQRLDVQTSADRMCPWRVSSRPRDTAGWGRVETYTSTANLKSTYTIGSLLIRGTHYVF